MFGAARSAMLKAMLPDELLAEANGALQSIREGLRLVAPLAGAGIYAAFGGGVVALVDAASFLGSAATLIALPFAEPERAVKRAPLPPRDLAGRLAHRTHARAARADDRRRRRAARRRASARRSIFAIVTNALHRSPAFIGVMESFQGVGAIARRPDVGASHAADRRAATRRDRARRVRARRHLLARPEARRRPPVDRRRRPRDRLGDRRARNRLPAPQPVRAAGPGRRGREYALQRAADRCRSPPAPHSSR